EQAEVGSVSGCVRLCYSRGCSVAGYSPPMAGDKPICLLAYSIPQECGKSEKVTDNNGTTIIEIHCVQCAGEPGVGGAPGSGTGATATATEASVANATGKFLSLIIPLYAIY